MSNANIATAFRRTEAGADELTQPKLGLSVPQRKMLRCCGTATSLNEIERLFAAEEAHYSRERFDRDLEKLEQYGLIQRTGAALKIVHTKPSAATIALPPQIKPTAQRAPELRTVSTAQPQPQRIVHALIGAGVIALAGTVFWLMSGPAPEQRLPAAGPATASEPANRHADPVFIDEPPAEPAGTATGKTAVNAKPAKLGEAQRSVKTPAAPAPGTHKINQQVAPQPVPAVPLPIQAGQPQPVVAAEPQRGARLPEATAAVIPDNQPLRPAAGLNMTTSIKPPSQPVAVQPPAAAPVAPPPAAAPAPVAVTAVRTAEPAPAVPREPETAARVEKKPATASGPRLAHREKAEFPPEALLSDIRKGTVRARLAIDESGNVTDVTIVGAQGGRLFSRPAIAALKKWRYEPTGQRETTVAEIEFRE